MSRNPTGASLATPSVPRKSRSPSADRGRSSAGFPAPSTRPSASRRRRRPALRAACRPSRVPSRSRRSPDAGPPWRAAVPVSTLQAIFDSSMRPFRLQRDERRVGLVLVLVLDAGPAWREGRRRPCAFLLRILECHHQAPPRRAPVVGRCARQRAVERGQNGALGLDRTRSTGGRAARQIERDLGEDAAGPRLHDDDAVGERHRLLDIMGDEHQRRLMRRPQGQQMLVQAGAGEGVERGERLVEQQAPWAGSPGRERWRRAAPVRRTVRAASASAVAGEPDAQQRALDARVRSAFGRSARPKAILSATVSQGSRRGS
jgi:hypothetical protein